MNALTIAALLKEAKTQLRQVSDTPLLDAEVLLAFVLNQSRSYLYAWPHQVVPVTSLQHFNDCLKRRLQAEPIAYLTGLKEFWSLELRVNTHTLIPRPETEYLVQAIIDFSPSLPSQAKIADLGTGSGAIALALAVERPNWQIVATDIAEAALKVAKENAVRLGISTVSFHQGYWCDALPHREFDVIVSNPPYIGEAEWAFYEKDLRFEPLSALVSGPDGLDAIREISLSAHHYLRGNGYLIVEHGATSGEAVRFLFNHYGYQSVYSLCDEGGRNIATVGKKPN